MPHEDDPRLTPARPDLAAIHLSGRVQADRYAAAQRMRVVAPCADLRARPDPSAGLETQALFGEPVAVYERKDGWAWVQLLKDRYVGYVREETLGPPGLCPAHRVSAVRAPLFSRADLKSPILALLPMNALIVIAETVGRYCRVEGGGWLADRHVAPASERAGDFVSVAEACLGAPYVWGGRTPDGLDCSGLVQVALTMAGVACPRDADMQERALGERVTGAAPPERGDLVFWRGHVGIVREPGVLLHANAHHMMVTSEPLQDVVTRSAALGSPVTSIRRIAKRA